MAADSNMQAANAPLLAVDNVTLQYKTEQHLVTATWRVGFEVFEGERFVVLGPSGCGKSTLLKAVAASWRRSRDRSVSPASRSTSPAPTA
jgi:NitT/TauT family transport system ATP-binding protein